MTIFQCQLTKDGKLEKIEVEADLVILKGIARAEITLDSSLFYGLAFATDDILYAASHDKNGGILSILSIYLITQWERMR